MAQITINIPDDKISDVKDALCDYGGYSANSGLTKAQFAKKVVADMVKDIYRSYVANNAAEQARVNAELQVKSVDIN
jgi:hypothetical protein